MFVFSVKLDPIVVGEAVVEGVVVDETFEEIDGEAECELYINKKKLYAK